MNEPPKILIVEDDPGILNYLGDVLTHFGYQTIKANDGLEALERFEEEPPDLVITDVFMPRLNGFDLCARIKDDRRTRLIPVVMVTGMNSLGNRVRGIEVGADDFLSKPVQQVELKARIRSLLRLKQVTDELENAEEVIFSLALAVEAKDHYTKGHCHRLAYMGVEVGCRLALSEEELQSIKRGGILHDIGKIGVPDCILLKPDLLDDIERKRIMEHPVKGGEICSPLRTLSSTLPIIYHHHERIDGQGYPTGLKGDDIPVGARIIAAADVFDALTTDRPYRSALPVGEAIQVLHEAVDDGHLDCDVVNQLIDIVKKKGIKTAQNL